MTVARAGAVHSDVMRICSECGAEFDDDAASCPYDGKPTVDGADANIGRLLKERYRLQRRVGAGSTATVYRVWDELEGRPLALKLLPGSVLRERYRARERYLRELAVCARLQHPHIVPLLDHGAVDAGGAFLVFPLVVGTRPPGGHGWGDTATVCRTALQVARAFEHAHGLGVVHRDVKPANVLLTAAPGGFHARLIDFGLARATGEVTLTATGALCGSPAYLAPEVVRGRPATCAVDHYALGCVLFEMLAGRPPFEGATPAVLRMHALDEPADIQELAEVPEGVAEAISILLCKDPSARLDGCDSAYALLAEQVGDATPPRSRGEDALPMDLLQWRGRIARWRTLARALEHELERPAAVREVLQEMQEAASGVMATSPSVHVRLVDEGAGHGALARLAAREAKLRLLFDGVPGARAWLARLEDPDRALP